MLDTSRLNVHELGAKVLAGVRRQDERRPAGDGALVRLQVRPAGRRRPRASTAGSCPTRTGCPSCGRIPAGTSRCATTCSPSRARTSSSTSYERAARPVIGAATSARASATPRSRSAAPAASTASVAMAEELARRLAGARRRHRRSCTATWGASERPRGAPAARPAGRRARRRPRAGRLAAGAAPGHRPAHRGRHGRRRRRLQRPAARELGRAAAGRPADGAGRAVRRRRLGPHLERGGAAPVPQRGRAARPRGRQPADRRAVGAARRPGRGPGLGGAGCSAPQGRVLPMSVVPLDIEAGRASSTPSDARRASRCAARSRSRPTRRPGAQRLAGAARARRPARRRCRRCVDADWVVLGPGLVVHQRDPAPARARAGRRAARRRRPAGCVALNLAPQPGETDGLLARRRTSRCSAGTPRT